METLQDLSLRLCAVSVFRDVLSDPVICALKNYLDMTKAVPLPERVAAYANFVHTLYAAGTENLSRYVQKIVNESENMYVRKVGGGKAPSEILKASFLADLETFDRLAALSPRVLRGEIPAEIFLPAFSAEPLSIQKTYAARVAEIGKYGYGMYAKHRMFYIGEDGRIVPVQNPDATCLADLVGYAREKKVIIDNTAALLAGKPAANILLTGDAGTGKSSTIKAVANALADDGLRIIEVRKEQLGSIPGILDVLSANPLKFILFIDDLSFGKDDDTFSALKAILEGSVSAKSKNVVIYATSNRRHLVKERFSDREGDDVHAGDTMQEILSLSERFGIQLTFRRPDKAAYLEIIRALSDKEGIEYDGEKLDAAAERFVLKRGIRSARAARQFVDGILAGNITDIR